MRGWADQQGGSNNVSSTTGPASMRTLAVQRNERALQSDGLSPSLRTSKLSCNFQGLQCVVRVEDAINLNG